MWIIRFFYRYLYFAVLAVLILWWFLFKGSLFVISRILTFVRVFLSLIKCMVFSLLVYLLPYNIRKFAVFCFFWKYNSLVFFKVLCGGAWKYIATLYFIYKGCVVEKVFYIPFGINFSLYFFVIIFFLLFNSFCLAVLCFLTLAPILYISCCLGFCLLFVWFFFRILYSRLSKWSSNAKFYFVRDFVFLLNVWFYYMYVGSFRFKRFMGGYLLLNPNTFLKDSFLMGKSISALPLLDNLIKNLFCDVLHTNNIGYELVGSRVWDKSLKHPVFNLFLENSNDLFGVNNTNLFYSNEILKDIFQTDVFFKFFLKSRQALNEQSGMGAVLGYNRYKLNYLGDSLTSCRQYRLYDSVLNTYKYRRILPGSFLDYYQRSFFRARSMERSQTVIYGEGQMDKLIESVVFWEKDNRWFRNLWRISNVFSAKKGLHGHVDLKSINDLEFDEIENKAKKQDFSLESNEDNRHFKEKNPFILEWFFNGTLVPLFWNRFTSILVRQFKADFIYFELKKFFSSTYAFTINESEKRNFGFNKLKSRTISDKSIIKHAFSSFVPRLWYSFLNFNNQFFFFFTDFFLYFFSKYYNQAMSLYKVSLDVLAVDLVSSKFFVRLFLMCFIKLIDSLKFIVKSSFFLFFFFRFEKSINRTYSLYFRVVFLVGKIFTLFLYLFKLEDATILSRLWVSRWGLAERIKFFNNSSNYSFIIRVFDWIIFSMYLNCVVVRDLSIVIWALLERSLVKSKFGRVLLYNIGYIKIIFLISIKNFIIFPILSVYGFFLKFLEEQKEYEEQSKYRDFSKKMKLSNLEQFIASCVIFYKLVRHYWWDVVISDQVGLKRIPLIYKASKKFWWFDFAVRVIQYVIDSVVRCVGFLPALLTKESLALLKKLFIKGWLAVLFIPVLFSYSFFSFWLFVFKCICFLFLQLRIYKNKKRKYPWIMSKRIYLLRKYFKGEEGSLKICNSTSTLVFFKLHLLNKFKDKQKLRSSIQININSNASDDKMKTTMSAERMLETIRDILFAKVLVLTKTKDNFSDSKMLKQNAVNSKLVALWVSNNRGLNPTLLFNLKNQESCSSLSFKELLRLSRIKALKNPGKILKNLSIYQNIDKDVGINFFVLFAYQFLKKLDFYNLLETEETDSSKNLSIYTITNEDLLMYVFLYVYINKDFFLSKVVSNKKNEDFSKTLFWKNISNLLSSKFKIFEVINLSKKASRFNYDASVQVKSQSGFGAEPLKSHSNLFVSFLKNTFKVISVKQSIVGWSDAFYGFFFERSFFVLVLALYDRIYYSIYFEKIFFYWFREFWCDFFDKGLQVRGMLLLDDVRLSEVLIEGFLKKMSFVNDEISVLEKCYIYFWCRTSGWAVKGTSIFHRMINYINNFILNSLIVRTVKRNNFEFFKKTFEISYFKKGTSVDRLGYQFIWKSSDFWWLTNTINVFDKQNLDSILGEVGFFEFFWLYRTKEGIRIEMLQALSIALGVDLLKGVDLGISKFKYVFKLTTEWVLDPFYRSTWFGILVGSFVSAWNKRVNRRFTLYEKHIFVVAKSQEKINKERVGFWSWISGIFSENNILGSIHKEFFFFTKSFKQKCLYTDIYVYWIISLIVCGFLVFGWTFFTSFDLFVSFFWGLFSWFLFILDWLSRVIFNDTFLWFFFDGILYNIQLFFEEVIYNYFLLEDSVFILWVLDLWYLIQFSFDNIAAIEQQDFSVLRFCWISWILFISFVGHVLWSIYSISVVLLFNLSGDLVWLDKAMYVIVFCGFDSTFIWNSSLTGDSLLVVNVLIVNFLEKGLKMIDFFMVLWLSCLINLFWIFKFFCVLGWSGFYLWYVKLFVMGSSHWFVYLIDFCWDFFFLYFFTASDGLNSYWVNEVDLILNKFFLGFKVWLNRTGLFSYYIFYITYHVIWLAALESLDFFYTIMETWYDICNRIFMVINVYYYMFFEGIAWMEIIFFLFHYCIWLYLNIVYYVVLWPFIFFMKSLIWIMSVLCTLPWLFLECCWYILSIVFKCIAISFKFLLEILLFFVKIVGFIVNVVGLLCKFFKLDSVFWLTLKIGFFPAVLLYKVIWYGISLWSFDGGLFKLICEELGLFIILYLKIVLGGIHFVFEGVLINFLRFGGAVEETFPFLQVLFDPVGGISILYATVYYYFLIIISTSFSYMFNIFAHNPQSEPVPDSIWLEELRKVEPNPLYARIPMEVYRLLRVEDFSSTRGLTPKLRRSFSWWGEADEEVDHSVERIAENSLHMRGYYFAFWNSLARRMVRVYFSRKLQFTRYLYHTRLFRWLDFYYTTVAFIVWLGYADWYEQTITDDDEDMVRTSETDYSDAWEMKSSADDNDSFRIVRLELFVPELIGFFESRKGYRVGTFNSVARARLATQDLISSEDDFLLWFPILGKYYGAHTLKLWQRQTIVSILPVFFDSDAKYEALKNDPNIVWIDPNSKKTFMEQWRSQRFMDRVRLIKFDQNEGVDDGSDSYAAWHKSRDRYDDLDGLSARFDLNYIYRDLVPYRIKNYIHNPYEDMEDTSKVMTLMMRGLDFFLLPTLVFATANTAWFYPQNGMYAAAARFDEMLELGSYISDAFMVRPTAFYSYAVYGRNMENNIRSDKLGIMLIDEVDDFMLQCKFEERVRKSSFLVQPKWYDFFKYIFVTNSNLNRFNDNPWVQGLGRPNDVVLDWDFKLKDGFSYFKFKRDFHWKLYSEEWEDYTRVLRGVKVQLFLQKKSLVEALKTGSVEVDLFSNDWRPSESESIKEKREELQKIGDKKALKEFESQVLAEKEYKAKLHKIRWELGLLDKDEDINKRQGFLVDIFDKIYQLYRPLPPVDVLSEETHAQAQFYEEYKKEELKRTLIPDRDTFEALSGIEQDAIRREFLVPERKTHLFKFFEELEEKREQLNNFSKIPLPYLYNKYDRLFISESDLNKMWNFKQSDYFYLWQTRNFRYESDSGREWYKGFFLDIDKDKYFGDVFVYRDFLLAWTYPIIDQGLCLYDGFDYYLPNNNNIFSFYFSYKNKFHPQITAYDYIMFSSVNRFVSLGNTIDRKENIWWHLSLIDYLFVMSEQFDILGRKRFTASPDPSVQELAEDAMFESMFKQEAWFKHQTTGSIFPHSEMDARRMFWWFWNIYKGTALGQFSDLLIDMTFVTALPFHPSSLEERGAITDLIVSGTSDGVKVPISFLDLDFYSMYTNVSFRGEVLNLIQKRDALGYFLNKGVGFDNLWFNKRESQFSILIDLMSEHLSIASYQVPGFFKYQGVWAWWLSFYHYGEFWWAYNPFMVCVVRFWKWLVNLETLIELGEEGSEVKDLGLDQFVIRTFKRLINKPLFVGQKLLDLARYFAESMGYESLFDKQFWNTLIVVRIKEMWEPSESKKWWEFLNYFFFTPIFGDFVYSYLIRNKGGILVNKGVRYTVICINFLHMWFMKVFFSLGAFYTIPKEIFFNLKNLSVFDSNYRLVKRELDSFIFRQSPDLFFRDFAALVPTVSLFVTKYILVVDYPLPVLGIVAWFSFLFPRLFKMVLWIPDTDEKGIVQSGWGLNWLYHDFLSEHRVTTSFSEMFLPTITVSTDPAVYGKIATPFNPLFFRYFGSFFDAVSLGGYIISSVLIMFYFNLEEWAGSKGWRDWPILHGMLPADSRFFEGISSENIPEVGRRLLTSGFLADKEEFELLRKTLHYILVVNADKPLFKRKIIAPDVRMEWANICYEATKAQFMSSVSLRLLQWTYVVAHRAPASYFPSIAPYFAISHWIDVVLCLFRDLYGVHTNSFSYDQNTILKVVLRNIPKIVSSVYRFIFVDRYSELFLFFFRDDWVGDWWFMHYFFNDIDLKIHHKLTYEKRDSFECGSVEFFVMEYAFHADNKLITRKASQHFYDDYLPTLYKDQTILELMRVELDRFYKDESLIPLLLREWYIPYYPFSFKSSLGNILYTAAEVENFTNGLIDLYNMRKKALVFLKPFFDPKIFRAFGGYGFLLAEDYPTVFNTTNIGFLKRIGLEFFYLLAGVESNKLYYKSNLIATRDLKYLSTYFYKYVGLLDLYFIEKESIYYDEKAILPGLASLLFNYDSSIWQKVFCSMFYNKFTVKINTNTPFYVVWIDIYGNIIYGEQSVFVDDTSIVTAAVIEELDYLEAISTDLPKLTPEELENRVASYFGAWLGLMLATGISGDSGLPTWQKSYLSIRAKFYSKWEFIRYMAEIHGRVDFKYYLLRAFIYTGDFLHVYAYQDELGIKPAWEDDPTKPSMPAPKPNSSQNWGEFNRDADNIGGRSW